VQGQRVRQTFMADCAKNSGVREQQVEAAVALLDGGRGAVNRALSKEATGTLDDTQCAHSEERLNYLRELRNGAPSS